MPCSAEQELIFERSLTKTAAMLAGALLLTGVSYYCISRRVFPVAFEAWLLGLMLGPVAILINVVSLFRAGPQVVFNEHGIHDLRTSWGLIAWNEIAAFQVGAYFGNRFLGLYLVDEATCLARLSSWARFALWLNRPPGFPNFTMRFLGLTPGITTAWKYLEQHHADKILLVPAGKAPAAIRS